MKYVLSVNRMGEQKTFAKFRNLNSHYIMSVVAKFCKLIVKQNVSILN